MTAKQYKQASKFYSKSKLAKILSQLRHYDLMSKGVFAQNTSHEEILKEMIFKIMPFFLPVISFSFDAALVVYFVISNLYRIVQQGYITRRFYGENAAKNAPVVVNSQVNETGKKNEKTEKTTKKEAKTVSKGSAVSSSEAKKKRTTAGSYENDSYLHLEKDVKSNKKTKKAKEEVPDRSKSKKTDNSSVSDKPIKTGRVTPSGTNIPRSHKKRKKKKRK